MGVPAFFRWLSKKYSSILVPCNEERNCVDGEVIPVDATLPNPNSVEFDNLYLDMNGIIHPCCHPEDKPAPANEDEMMLAIFDYIDRIFNIIRPRKLLYMAIDGVAPRAKMNQQRSRRFRASKESREKKEAMKNRREEMAAAGCDLPPEKASDSHFDSNCITPGTEFMFRLAKCLRFYIHDRMNKDPAWQKIKVILSDANVPGEGEHKVMDFIRKQRSSPGHDPNTHHCLYGADADLIMLGLATHEPHFTILREEFKPTRQKTCEMCSQIGHSMADCTGLAREKRGEFDEFAVQDDGEKSFIFIRLCVLREYLAKELRMDGLSFPFDLERAIDDWVFMCFFVGNDFLPHLPSLEIREGAIDRLINLYKAVLPQTHGYLTQNGKVNLERVQLILNSLGLVEDEIFKMRRENELEMRRRQKERKKRQKLENEYISPSWVPREGSAAAVPIGPGGPSGSATGRGIRQEAYKARISSMKEQHDANKEAAVDLRNWLRMDQDSKDHVHHSKSTPSLESQGNFRKRPPPSSNEAVDSDEEVEDDVKLWEEGWKERYYNNKFEVKVTSDFRKRVVEAYTRGLCWVLAYYYQGCPSWKWYYPFHYAPFASDFVGIDKIDNTFKEKTTPFKPLEQLMSVFPGGSSYFLPPSWRKLMVEPDSEIIDFYPIDFKIDLNGKKFAWQGVALLPFVDEGRLLNVLDKVYPDLLPEEILRNSLGSDRLFTHKSHPVFESLSALCENVDSNNIHSVKAMPLNADLTQGMSGDVLPEDSPDNTLPGKKVLPPIPKLEPVKRNQVLCVKYSDPPLPDGFIFKATLLPRVRMPDPVLRPGDHVGYFKPQLGFIKSDRTSPYGTPDHVQRFVRGATFDPKRPHQSDQQTGRTVYFHNDQNQYGQGGHRRYEGNDQWHSNRYGRGGEHHHQSYADNRWQPSRYGSYESSRRPQNGSQSWQGNHGYDRSTRSYNNAPSSLTWAPLPVQQQQPPPPSRNWSHYSQQSSAYGNHGNQSAGHQNQYQQGQSRHLQDPPPQRNEGPPQPQDKRTTNSSYSEYYQKKYWK